MAMACYDKPTYQIWNLYLSPLRRYERRYNMWNTRALGRHIRQRWQAINAHCTHECVGKLQWSGTCPLKNTHYLVYSLVLNLALIVEWVGTGAHNLGNLSKSRFFGGFSPRRGKYLYGSSWNFARKKVIIGLLSNSNLGEGWVNMVILSVLQRLGDA